MVAYYKLFNLTNVIQRRSSLLFKHLKWDKAWKALCYSWASQRIAGSFYIRMSLHLESGTNYIFHDELHYAVAYATAGIILI